MIFQSFPLSMQLGKLVKARHLKVLLNHKYANLTSCHQISNSSSKGSLDFSGVFTPIVTPFNKDETIAYDKLDDNLKKWNATNLKGYLVEGSNGEAVHLTMDERLALVEHVHKNLPAGKMLLAGSGCESTAATQRLSVAMAEAGADAVMVVTPSYYKAALTDRAIINHYEKVADASPVPILLYSVPANTGVELSVAAAAVLSQHSNVVGMKDSGGDITKIAALVHATADQDFQVLAGSAGFLLASLHVGCVGGVCALANLVPELVCRLYELGSSAATSGAALRLQYELLAVNTAVTKGFGVAGLKQAMDWRGLYGGPTRLPLMPLTAPEVDALRKIVDKVKG